MTRTTMRRAAALAVLAAGLFLPLPSEAAGQRRGPSTPSLLERAWKWVAAWVAPEAGTRPEPIRVFGADGGHIDPNGNNSAVPPCPPEGCLPDPNG